MSEDHNSVVVYRLEKLEEAVMKLSTLSDVVTRWDERFSQQGGLIQCNLHAARMGDIEKQLTRVAAIIAERTKAILLVEEHELKIKDMQKEIETIKTFVNRALGALVLLSIIVQLFGPYLRDYLFHAVHVNPPTLTK